MENIQINLFCIEMIGFLITAIIWSLKALSRDMFMEYWVGSLVLFWVCTNFLHFLLCAARLAEQGAEAIFILERFELLMIAMSPKYHEFWFLVIYSVVTICFTCCGYSGESHGDSSCTRIAEEQEDSSMDSFTGGEWVVCWVQRLSMLGSYGFTLLLHSSTYNQGLAMLHLCFFVLFPLLIGYFTWQGFWKDFLSDDDDEESETSDVATAEDVQEESMHMEIENATEENRQKYLSESIIENKKNNTSATSAVEDVTGTVLNQIEGVKGKVLNETEAKLNKFLVKSEDSCQHFQKDFTERNDKCCTNVVRKMLRDQEERSLQHLLKEFGDIKDDSLVSKIEDAVEKLLRIQEKRIHMKLVTALEQNRHGCMGNCEDSLKKAIENSEKYKEKSEQLAWKLQLYRDLLHDPDVSIFCVG